MDSPCLAIIVTYAQHGGYVVTVTPTGSAPEASVCKDWGLVLDTIEQALQRHGSPE